MRQSKLSCTINGEWSALAHLGEAALGEFSFWFGVLDVSATAPELLKLGDVNANVLLRFEDGRLGVARPTSARFRGSTGRPDFGHAQINEALEEIYREQGLDPEAGESALLAFVGLTALKQPA